MAFAAVKYFANYICPINSARNKSLSKAAEWDSASDFSTNQLMNVKYVANGVIHGNEYVQTFLRATRTSATVGLVRAWYVVNAVRQL